MNNSWQIEFQFRDLFIKFLHKQALDLYAVTKPDFSDFQITETGGLLYSGTRATVDFGAKRLRFWSRGLSNQKGNIA